MSFIKAFELETVVKTTKTRCTRCRKEVPGSVIKVIRDGREQVVMRRDCPEHGIEEYVIASDPRFYWHAEGDPSNRACGCGPGGCSPVSPAGKAGYLGANALDKSRLGIIEKLSTCTALIEIVKSCNLKCPTCFSDSPQGTGDNVDCYPFDDVVARVQGVLDRKRHIDMLQFSGGEPTIHPEFYRLVEWVRSNPNIKCLLINTNGLRFATDDEFVEKMDELQKRLDYIHLYLQFDGIQQAGQIELRGGDFRAVKKKAIENCARIGLPVTLAMTVSEHNLPYVWETLSFGLEHEVVRGVSFQPKFLSGRVPDRARKNAMLPQPITSADILIALNEQSKGAVNLEDFTPMPCGDPNCLIVGWRFRMEGQSYSPKKMGVDVARLQRQLPDRVSYRLEDLQRCGCDDTELGELTKRLESESNAFRITVKPFMDDRTWDEDRIDRCCTHVIRPDGKLDSFCRYYSGLDRLASSSS